MAADVLPKVSGPNGPVDAAPVVIVSPNGTLTGGATDYETVAAAQAD